MTAFRLGSVRAKSAIPRPAQIRSAHDLILQHNPQTGKANPVIKYGPPTGGRSAASGHVATVFGCTGFLGRYVVAKLAKIGTQVVVPYRDEDEKRHLKVTGDLGQVVPLEWDARNAEQIAECVRHSDVVYNLAGRDWETRNFSYDDINVKAAGLIAKVCADVGVGRLIHVSHLNASPDSTSAFYRSKYAGERAVRDAFPEATIVRPAALFGGEDWLLNAIAQYPILYKLNNGQTKSFPVHVLDVASALNTMLTAPVTSVASTFALPGPQLLSYNGLQNIVSSLTMKPVSSAPTLPKPVAVAIATVLNRGLWWPTISPDEVERKYIDDFGVEALERNLGEEKPSGWGSDVSDLGMKGIDGEPVKGFADLDITPDTVAEHAIKYLRRYRSSANFDLPAPVGEFKPQKNYHVVP